MSVHGRRIGARSRLRTGDLTESDGTLDAAVAASDPGTSTDDGGSDGLLGIEVGVSIGL